MKIKDVLISFFENKIKLTMITLFLGSSATGTTSAAGTVTTTRQTIITPSGQRVILMGTQSGQKQIVTVPGATTMTPVAGAVPDQPEVTQATQVKPAIPNQPQQLQQVQQL